MMRTPGSIYAGFVRRHSLTLRLIFQAGACRTFMLTAAPPRTSTGLVLNFTESRLPHGYFFSRNGVPQYMQVKPPAKSVESTVAAR